MSPLYRAPKLRANVRKINNAMTILTRISSVRTPCLRDFRYYQTDSLGFLGCQIKIEKITALPGKNAVKTSLMGRPLRFPPLPVGLVSSLCGVQEKHECGEGCLVIASQERARHGCQPARHESRVKHINESNLSSISSEMTSFFWTAWPTIGRQPPPGRKASWPRVGRS